MSILLWKKDLLICHDEMKGFHRNNINILKIKGNNSYHNISWSNADFIFKSCKYKIVSWHIIILKYNILGYDV